MNPEDKICACHSISNLSSQYEARNQIIERKFSRECAPLLLESDCEVVGAALGCLYNLSSQGAETVEHLVSQDIMTPLTALIGQFGGIVNIEDKQQRQKREQIITDSCYLLWNLLQESDQVLDMFNRSNLVSHLTPLITNIVSPGVRVASMSVLVTGCDNNKQCQDLVTPHMDTIANMVTDQGEDTLVRSTAALLLVTACSDKQKIINDKV